MFNTKKTVSLGLLGLMTAGFMAINTQAGQGSQHGPPPFSDFDLDDSGFVSEDEFNQVRGERMAAKAAEGKQMRGAATAPAFADLDTDGDGQLNAAELTAGQKAHMEKVHAKGKGQGHGNGHGSGKGHGGGKGAMKGNMPTFSDFDLDGDGTIVESEFNQAHAQKMSEMAAAGHQMKHAGDAPGFTGIDTDENGEISEAEFSAHQAEHHQKHKAENKKN